jgi:hypothetical protein
MNFSQKVRQHHIIVALFVCLFAGLGTYLLLASHASVITCNLYASTTGSDSNGGSSRAPLASLTKLESSLSAGQTGCLQAGIYGSISTYMQLTKSGNSAAPITIRNAPGQTVTLKGWIEVDGAYITLSHLSIDGSNTFYNGGGACNHTMSNPSSQGLEISGAGDVLEYDDIYQSVASLRGNLIGVGWWGQPDAAVLRYNKLHDAGSCLAYDHLIYLSHGNNVQIYGNWLWNDANGWGIQIYPDPSDAHVYSNVIDATGSGVVIGNESGNTVSNNQIDHNVIMDLVGLPSAGLSQGVAISDSWGGTLGIGNSFTNNDSYNNSGGISHVSNVTVSNNIITNPLFVDAVTHDYTLQSGSPVASYGLWDGTDPTFGSSAGAAGDFNGDGHVNIFDLSIFLSHWQQAGSSLPEDLNGDGVVNIFDLSVLLSNYGK